MIRSLFRGRISDAWVLVVFFLLVGVFFYPVALQGKVPVPSDTLVGLYHPWRDLYSDTNPRGLPFKNFLITDPVRQQIPWRKIVIDQWKQGMIPSWNPYNFSGTPLIANIQAAVFYPLNIFFMVFPFVDAWSLFIIVQPMLAGLFMYWFLRSLGIKPVASLIGAVSWSFSGFNVAWLTWGTIGHVALWLPLTLLSVDKLFSVRAVVEKKTVWSVIFVLSFVFQFFAGHSQISLYFMFIIAGYAATRIYYAKDWKKLLILLLLLLSMVALLTAVQWMPLIDWIRQSSRVLESADWHKEGWFIPWAHLAQFVSPDFFGNPTTLNYWGQWNYGEFVGYIGIIPLVFVVLTLLSGIEKSYRYWMGILAIAFIFAFPTPVAMMPFLLNIPVLSAIQPTRLLFVIDFALVVLAAYGFQLFFDHTKGRRWMWSIGTVGMIFVILWAIPLASRAGLLDPGLQRFSAVSIRNLILPTVLFLGFAVTLIIYRRFMHIAKLGRIVQLGVLMLVVLDLFRFAWKFTPFTDRKYFFPETNVISFLKNQKQPMRIMSLDKRIMPPNTASYFGIESLEGYDPIISSRYEELMAAVARGKPDITEPFGFNRIITLESLRSPLLPMLNVQYVLSLSDLSEPYLRNVFTEGETRVYEDTRAFPRVWAVEQVSGIRGKQESIHALYKASDLRREAIVEGDISILPVPMRSDESVSLAKYQPNAMHIATSFSVPRFVVVSNTYNQGWTAAIDGNKTKIYRTNYAFQGIVVPQGKHSVTFSYAL